MQPRRTQNQLILSELKSNPTGISSIEAFSKFGITRLSARIYDLRREGHTIYKRSESRNRKNYARFFMLHESPFPPEGSDAAEIPFAAVA